MFLTVGIENCSHHLSGWHTKTNLSLKSHPDRFAFHFASARGTAAVPEILGHRGRQPGAPDLFRSGSIRRRLVAWICGRNESTTQVNLSWWMGLVWGKAQTATTQVNLSWPKGGVNRRERHMKGKEWLSFHLLVPFLFLLFGYLFIWKWNVEDKERNRPALPCPSGRYFQELGYSSLRSVIGKPHPASLPLTHASLFPQLLNRGTRKSGKQERRGTMSTASFWSNSPNSHSLRSLSFIIPSWLLPL